MRFAFLAAALLLSACASAPVYAPASAPGRPGYSEQRIESDRYRVTYRAPSGGDPGLVETFALRRAAEITVEAGRAWFFVDNRRLERGADSRPRLSIGVGGGSFGRRSGGGVGVGVGFPIGGGSGETATAAILDIRLGAGAKPADANAYDARDVLRTAPSR